MQHSLNYSGWHLLFLISTVVFFHHCVSIHPAMLPIAATGLFIGISIAIKENKAWLMYTSVVLAGAGTAGFKNLFIAITTLGIFGGSIYVFKRCLRRSTPSTPSTIRVYFSKQKGVERVLELATALGIKNISYQVGSQAPYTLELNYVAAPLSNHLFIRSIITIKSVNRVDRVSDSSSAQ